MALSLTGTLTPRYGSSLVAPLVVNADVFGLTVTANSETHPLHKVHFSWDFGDPTSTETFVDPLTGQTKKSNSDQIGPQAAHIYKAPGTYRITVTAAYYDTGTSTWLTASRSSAYFVVTSESAAGWDVAYYDPSDLTSLQDGTRDEPFVSLAQAQAFLDRRDTRTLYIARGSTIVPKSSSVQTVTIDATGGTFTITYNDPSGAAETTVPIAYNASIYAVYAALRELPSIGRRGVVVTGTPGAYTITFAGHLAERAISTLGTSAASLTGGASTATPASVTTGGVALNQSVLSITDTTGLRIAAYQKVGGPSSPPVLQLGSAANAKAVVSVVGDNALAAQSAIQAIRINATAGNFKLTYVSRATGVSSTTSAIAYNASAGTVQSALEGLTSIGAGNVTVAAVSGGGWNVTFAGALANLRVNLISAASDTGGTPLSGGTPSSWITTDWVQQGYPAHTRVYDVLLRDLVLDGSSTTDSIGLDISAGGSADGYTADFYLMDVRIANTLKQPWFVEAVVGAGGQGPQALGAFRTSFDASTSSGDTVLFASASNSPFIGCTFRGGVGNENDDNHIQMQEYGSVAQTSLLFRWCYFTEATKKNFGVLFAGASTNVSIIANRFDGIRNGLYVSANAYATVEDVYIEGNEFSNLGLSNYANSHALWIKNANNVTVRNNLFYENGNGNGGADTAGSDIFVENAGVVSGLNDNPIRIEHNSFYRSYGRAGAPSIQIDDDRSLEIFNNVIQYEGGGIGAADNPLRSAIQFTNSSYVLPPRNARWSVAITGNPTGGSIRLTVGAYGTTGVGAIVYNASAASVQSALEGVTGGTGIGPGNVTVTGPAGGPWIITFVGALANTSIPSITMSTNSLTGGTAPSTNIASLVTGSAGLVFIDGNRYWAPNLLQASVNLPFSLDGANNIPFSSDLAEATWQNAGNQNATTAWDLNGAIVLPGFRNPLAGNFRFGQTDPLVDSCAATHRGVRFDFRGSIRSGVPDAGAFEFDGAASDGIFSYQPSAITDLPTAGAISYRSGDVQYIDALEPVSAASILGVPGLSGLDVDNRPSRHLAARDNIIGASVDGLLDDINTAFCSLPQAGSAFTSRHRSISSFMSVGHNPDGTLKLSGADLGDLPYLRTDGGNSMLADLSMGSGANRIVNLAAGTEPNHGVNYGQTVLRNGANAMTGNLDMGSNKITNLAPATQPSDAVRLDQIGSGFTSAAGYGAGSYQFTVPAGVRSLRVRCVGGGGGGAGHPYPGSDYVAPWVHRKGGDGGDIVAIIAVTPGEVCSLVVGAGGSAGVFSPNDVNPFPGNGSSGGNTTFTCTGGSITAVGGGGAQNWTATFNAQGAVHAIPQLDGGVGVVNPLGRIKPAYGALGNNGMWYGRGGLSKANVPGLVGHYFPPTQGQTGLISIEW